MEPSKRIKMLADQAQLRVDRNAPIRRYYNSGPEMLRMGDTYAKENNLEHAYILYVRYLTLFVEKIQQHPDYKTFSLAEKNKAVAKSKEVMKKSEDLKLKLKLKFKEEYEAYLAEEEERQKLEEEERKKKQQEEELRKMEEVQRYQEEKERSISAQRDYETALFHQIQADKEFEREQIEQAIKKSQISDEQVVPKPVFNRANKPVDNAVTATNPAIPARSKKPVIVPGSIPGGLRRLIVPEMVLGKFLSVAQANTARNVETCANLAGRLANNMFTITHLIVPKQNGTPDSCTTSCEEEIFSYQEKHGLITLGWIHTHPSQTAFLSSVDLHTHASYQMMLPEAVAIVCAPKFNETGYFVLTNHGLDLVGNCRETGFHPHPKEPPLFEDGSHIDIDQNGDVSLVDLR